MVEQQMAQGTAGGGGGDNKPIGLSVASMVLGIISIPTAWPCFLFGSVGAIVGVIAIVLGAAALKKNNEGTHGGRGMAIAGLVTGIIGLIIALIFMLLILLFGMAFGAAAEEMQRELERQQQQNGPGASMLLDQVQMARVFVSALI